VQLSPKSIFVGLVAVGLPIAIAIGWNLAGPVRPPAAATLDGGTGGIGAAAPDEGAGDGDPLTSVRYSARPYRPPATSPSTIASLPASATVAPASGSPSSPAAPVSGPSSSSSVPLPPLDNPPVPTPTEIVDVPGPSSSADPSGPPSSQP
jgi:hypothetical protein